MQINWDSFKVHNQDAKGIRYKFEDLCRQLFANENLSGNKRYRYLHSNPANAGLETEPIFDEVNQRWIGFQAKYFDSAVDYDQILHSAQKTIEHYTGQEGIVDLVYLYSNQPIKTTAKGYINTESLLKDAGIELQLVTNDAILDLVRGKYPYLALYYFGNQSISHEWFITHSEEMFIELGERYNREFNVESIFSDEISLFVRDGKAADYLNRKKEKLIKTIEAERYRHYGYQSYLIAIAEKVSGLKDVDVHTFSEAFNWYDAVKGSVASFLGELENKKLAISEKIAALSGESHERRAQIRELYRDIDEIDDLLSLVDQLSVTGREHELFEKSVLILKGEAGNGKSQLLAWKTKELLDENRAVLLLIAGIYFTDNPVADQIMNNLRFRYSFDELIDALETIGEKDNRIVPVFVDALNETSNTRLWKTGLSAIIKKINESPMVKLVISYRTEYENTILPDGFLARSEQYVSMYHTGFEENSTPAIKEFLHRYNIPFSPIAYFGYEMTNPLFLTLFCKTYDGNDVSLPALFEKVIMRANRSLYRTFNGEFRKKGYSEDYNLLGELINEIAIHLMLEGKRYISQHDLKQLSFWADHGIAPEPYIYQLAKEQILYDSSYQEEKNYHLSYDQMNDYFCAKAIMNLCKTKDEIRDYLSKSVLGIAGQTIEKSWNAGLFAHACAMFAEKYHEECIDIIDTVDDSYEKNLIVSRFIDSFQWRNTHANYAESAMQLFRKYPCQPDDVWPMLIGNSMKINHPLNADFLHNLLMSYKLNRRDWLWTLYINKLTLEKTDRLVQLIEMYDQGEELEITSIEQIELLLTLLCWILTSSNRRLRDYASKAMVEILKKHISLCKKLLEKFKNVDDPYVISRLYGVIFGACCKRTCLESIQPLAEYVYENVFNQEKVYPDVLLRDYARLIIERFLYEEPKYTGVIVHEKIVPPYNSDPIPEIEDQKYLQQDWNGGLFRIIHSMRFDGMGMYGDFGRYVFQTAMHSFDVDDRKIFNYAIYYILNELGYKEEYFGVHDKNCGSYDRHDTIKEERIGKKYQWITMYNILARVSDHYRMLDRWSIPPRNNVSFEGPWDPYVRDFDPTLNKSAMKCAVAPKFKKIDELIKTGKEENKKVDLSTEEKRREWLEEKGSFFRNLKTILILNDENGTNWVCLTTCVDTGRKNLEVDEQFVWSWLYARFITQEQEEMIVDTFKKGQSILTAETAHCHEIYTVFNREYPWSPGCTEVVNDAWVEVEFETGEYVEEPVDSSSMASLNTLLQQYGISDEKEDEPEYKYYKRAVKKSIGKILQATTDLLWEEEFDATKELSISYSVPCGELIETMQLRQLEADGFYFDQEGVLAAFDADLVQNINSVIIRKDILDGFLEKTGLKLAWFVDAGKEIHDGKEMCRSEWETLFVYSGEVVKGDLRHIRTL